MSDDTLLAHLAHRLGRGSEDLATEALAYLLLNPAAARGATAHARRWNADLPEIAAFRTQDWLAADEAIPDVVGVSAEGVTPLIVEAKFGAALTPNQPVTYLRRLLGQDFPALLLFLVPTRRVIPIWSELRRRCSDEGLELVQDENPAVPRALRDNVVVAVTTWKDLLDDLERALTPPSEHHRTLSELDQLRGLCGRADQAVFEPFTTDFLGGTVGQRLTELDALINEAVDGLVASGLASTKGLQRSAGTGWYGRYFRMAGWECFLHVNFDRWGRQRPTPLWLRINDRRTSGHPSLMDALGPLVNAAPPRLLFADGLLQIPIHLPHDVDRDAVFAAIDGQLQEVHGLLATCPPDVVVDSDRAAHGDPHV